MYSRPEACEASMPPVPARQATAPRRIVEPAMEPVNAAPAADEEPGLWTGGLFVLVALLVASVCAWRFVDYWMVTSIAAADVAPAVLSCGDAAGSGATTVVVDLHAKNPAGPGGEAEPGQGCIDAGKADARSR